ncbi:Nudix hydrolase 14, chloroplastic [Cladophialophora carrionii]|uniref:Nudix hydrolase 14, chloroplastic n=1 Tax=Cladophialophora carrionii TaxID=86049 RepID=A0A1C1CGZ2_9EURO|nr:Nudix hydrolase 14, chloroplastic [Cladophialophora carrionii]
MATTFTLPREQGEPLVEVRLPANITREQFLEFKPFELWLKTLRQSLRLQSNRDHVFHERKERHALRSINVQSVDWFGTRIGFIKMETVVSNENGSPLPGIVFLRGGSVAILMILRPQVGDTNSDERFVVMTQQPRVPAGSLNFFEIPAGMIDDAKTFVGAAANELYEETGLTISQHELKDMTKLALKDAKGSESHLQKAMYPSPGGCDEYIALFLWERTMPLIEIMELKDRLSGTDKEKITVKLVKYEELWREGARDAKTLAAWALYEGLTREGSLEDDEDDEDE